ncbi:MAG: hypothetical protein NZ898_08345 [Myxococcota bacterium]|nr:hypothetical protein [Myxococcota bacterium]MDW8361914.1 hypothetical protein [Myxococcales bacterium]
MNRRPASRLPEAPREEHETGFTRILRALWRSDARALAACYVDADGECIDYCSSLDPFDAKVAGAALVVPWVQLLRRAPRLGGGRPRMLRVRGERREAWLRAVTDETVLVLLRQVDPGETPSVDDRLARWLDRTARLLRHEARWPVPTWEPRDGLRVELRSAVGWPHAPVAFEEHGVRVLVSDVLGRWVEEDWLECFRVRTAEGLELTLEHETWTDHWASAP